MSAYDNDPRVEPIVFGSFKVATGGPHGGHVFQRDGGDWAARSGYQEPGQFTGGFESADEAIRSLIGDPQ